MIVVQPKNVTITDLGLTFQVVFDATDFGASTGYAQLEGPLSLTLLFSTTSGLKTPLYFGVTLETDIGLTRVADREHIGFMAVKSALVVISPVSVPQLGNIDGVIKRVLVNISAFRNFGNATLNVALIIDGPRIGLSPQPLIGKDSSVYHAGVHRTSDSTVLAQLDVQIAAITNNQEIARFTPATPQRALIRTILLGAQATPSFPGDLTVDAYIERNGGTENHRIARCHSKQFDWNDLIVSGEWYVNIGDAVKILASNGNAANTYAASAVIQGENIY